MTQPQTSTSWIPARSTSNVWRPHAGQQTAFMASWAEEALYGGSAGPGKTDCLVMEATRQIANSSYNGILLRRIFPSLETADGMIARSHRWYPSLGGEYNWAKHYWTFPSGARIYFGHMQHETSKFLYQGAQFSFIGFDELTEFLESQYMFMISRLRSASEAGLRNYIRACTNPGNVGHLWVKDRFITRGIVNVPKWFALVNGKDTEVDKTTQYAKSRVFYPARLEDNPSLGYEYRSNLEADPDAVQRARLIEGNWDAIYLGGLVYPNFSTLPGGNINPDLEYDPNRPIVWGVDDGYAYGKGVGSASYHPRVVLVGQVNALGGLNILDEYCETGISDYQQTVTDVLNKGYDKPTVIYIDSSAAMFAGMLWNQGKDVVRATHSVHEGIRNLRQLVCDENNMRLIQIHPRCQNLIYEFGSYLYNEDAQGKNGEPVAFKQNDHSLDALRYLAWPLRYGSD